MRVTVSHHKTQQEVTKIVDKSINDLITNLANGPVQIIDPQKHWEGSVLHFSFVGKKSFFKTTITGTVEVTDKDVIIDCELPGILSHFIPEAKVQQGLEDKVKGLLA